MLQTDSPVIGEINSSFVETSMQIASANLDPRSPSVEFTRTPLVIDKSSVKLRNKNLDVVRGQIINAFPKTKGNLDTNETSNEKCHKKHKEPILLESSPINKKCDEKIEKRKSYLGLLETNLDYIETDLDEIQRNNFKKIEKVNDEIEDNISQCSQYPSNLEVVENIDKEMQIIAETCNENTLTFDVFENKNEVQVINDNEPKNFNDQSEIQNPVNDFDKKITNLIYEDKDNKETLITTKVSKPKDGGRTPLGDHNINKDMRRRISKLKVSDKPSAKGDYAVSKIPVFKSKKSAAIQCENTPPPLCNVSENRIKNSKWDSDKTLII